MGKYIFHDDVIFTTAEGGVHKPPLIAKYAVIALFKSLRKQNTLIGCMRYN